LFVILDIRRIVDCPLTKTCEAWRPVRSFLIRRACENNRFVVVEDLARGCCRYMRPTGVDCMTKRRNAFSIRLMALLGALMMAASPVVAQETKGSSGLPLPRFVTLKPKKVNLRVGPGQDYAASWLYQRQGLPVEIIQEYDNWRRIRDADGTEGWVLHSLVSGDRAAIAAPWMRNKGANVFVNLRSDSRDSASVLAKLQPGVIIKIDECNGLWCHGETQGVEGWVSQAEIWGAYPGEVFTK